MSHNRPGRVAELIHAEIARVLREEISDPRLSAVSITRVAVTPDLRTARVYVLPLGGQQDVAPILAGLEAARGFIKRFVGQAVVLRYLPELQFLPDTHLDTAVRVTALLSHIASQETPAEPAGDNEPEGEE